ncbi:DUF3696 domain-containing protein [Microbispora sp. CA-135349]|uniref:DUF3696 domain-containing protein n=1 Tax=Microbispora sp. CA-135349 TaxID=3239953 RepID=UPI003D8E7092
MPLISFTVENYRCFAKPQKVELRPITVVLGRNNSGKSALVRTPLLLQAGIRTMSRSPFDLDQLGDEAPEFRHLVHGGRPHGSIRLGLEFAGGPTDARSVDVTVQNIDEWQDQVVRQLAVTSGSATTTLMWLDEYELDRAEQEDKWDEPHLYVARTDLLSDAAPPGDVVFHGLLPATPVNFGNGWNDDWDPEDLSADVEAIRADFDQVRYLGPYRDRPARVHRLPPRLSSLVVGADGEQALSLLAHDRLRRHGRVNQKLNELLTDHLPGWSLQVEDLVDDLYSVVLRSRETGLEVNLADAGTGVAQLLPILIQRAVDAANPPREPVLEIVEEPELHLHPSAHALVADGFLAATKASKVRFLIETHSETFLLRLRRRVAEGIVDPEDIAIYFVENNGGAASARRIRLDGLGNLDYWPRGVFAEDFEETRALAAAQAERTDTDAR